jgi:two-component system response regulator LytT
MKLNILLIEDEPLAMEQLEIVVGKDDRFNIVGKIDSIADGLEWFKHNKTPDLVLSDVQLSDGNSLDLFAKLDQSLKVIFITAYDQYAIDAFKMQAVDYLLKPFEDTKLINQLNKVYEQNNAQIHIDYQHLADLVIQKMHPPEKKFLLKFAGQLIHLKSSEIAYCFIEDKLPMCMTKEGKRYPLDEPLDQLEEELSEQFFFRINRGMIVNKESIKRMIAYSRSRIKLELDPPHAEDAIVSRDKTPIFKNWLVKYSD